MSTTTEAGLRAMLAWHQAHARGATDSEAERIANDVYMKSTHVALPSAVYAEWDRFVAYLDGMAPAEASVESSG